MSMPDLVIDRTQGDVQRFLSIIAKINSSGWDSLTEAEKSEITDGTPIDLYSSDGYLLTDSEGNVLQTVNGSIYGSYNYADLNRVGQAVQYLADLLNSYGYTVTVSVKTDWAVGEYPNTTQMTTYLNNVTTLKTAFNGTTTLPTSMNSLKIEQANNIEKLLLEIETYITNMLTAFRHSGTAISGLGGLIA